MAEDFDEFLLDLGGAAGKSTPSENENDNIKSSKTPSIGSLATINDDDLAAKFQIKRFKNSLNEPLNAHFFAADSTINLINETKLNWDQQKIFDSYKKNIVGSCESIIQLHDKYYFALSLKNLEKEAEREFYSEFQGTVNKNKVQFYQILFSYQVLKSFNLKVHSYWHEIEKILTELLSASEISKFAGTLLEDKVNPMLLLIDQTSELLKRMSLLIQLKEENVDNYSKEVKVKAEYVEGRNYAMIECFQGEIPNQRRREIEKEIVIGSLNKKEEVKSERQVKLSMSPQIDKSKLGSIKNFSLDRVEQQMGKKFTQAHDSDDHIKKKDQNRVYLEIVGGKAWNQSKFYQLSYDEVEYQKDLAKMKSAVYFTNSEDVLDENSIRKKVAINLARRNRLNILKDLQDFIFHKVEEVIDKLISFFELPNEAKLIFTFHLGAGHFSDLMKAFLQNNKLGICYLVTSNRDGNKIKKEFFSVFIDEAVKRFWETRINIAYDESFDNFWEYSKISDIIRKKYQTELEIHRRKLDAIFAKMGTAKNAMLQKENYFQGHFIEWFGLQNIYVYKRFVERSIFTNWNVQETSARKSWQERFRKNRLQY